MNERIALVRKSLGLTQEKFAEQVGLSRNFMWMIESGTRVPSDRTISDICREFNVNETWLRTGEGEMFNQITRSEKITSFLTEITESEGDDFKRRFVEMLAELEPEDWKLLERMAEKLQKKRETRKGFPSFATLILFYMAFCVDPDQAQCPQVCAFQKLDNSVDVALPVCFVHCVLLSDAVFNMCEVVIMASICPVCGGKLGLLNREKSADSLICAGCSSFFFSKLGFRAAKQPTAALAEYWATLEIRRRTFKETDSIFDRDALFVSIDKVNRLFYFGHRGGDKGPRMIYSFDEVAGYESDAPDDLTVTETKGGIGRAVIGAAVAGPVGAIVGAATAKTETRKGSSKESVSIHFVLPLGESSLPTTVYPGGMTAFLKSCKVSHEKSQAAAPVAPSAADELLKFKQLLDMGAITEAEYSAKKSQLLGL